MQNWKKYYDKTKKEKPRNNVKGFIENIKIEPTNAIDLGCGSGNDTIYLIQNNWSVLGIDKENVEEIIRERLSQDKQKYFQFKKQKLEDLKIPNTDLIIANFSLSFCTKEYFKLMWQKIVESINLNGYFVGTILGINDSWNKECRDMSFFDKEDVKRLFNKFKIIRFEEIENDKPTALGEEKHWHFYSIIAQKEYKNEYRRNFKNIRKLY